MRSVANPILMQPLVVNSYIPVIDEIANEFIENIPKIQDGNGEMPGNFHDYINRLMLESIVAITLEKRLGMTNFSSNNELGSMISKNIRKIINMGLEYETKLPFWKIYKTENFKEYLKAYDDLTE